MPSVNFFLRAGAVALIASIYGPAFYRLLNVMGVFRQASSSHVEPSDWTVIEDTVHCEDLHHHLPSNTIFTACEGSADTRFSWFPGLTTLDDPIKAMQSQGSIHVIDPKTLKSKRLEFENYKGPFITHGIDVISDTENPEAVYIFAVNHLPHPDYVGYKEQREGAKDDDASGIRKARSQIEVFHHELGSSTVKHVRSIRHSLINTPNDIVARTPSSIYITNDHYYPEGHMRLLEDVYHGAKWSNIVNVQIGDMSETNPTSGLDVSVAVTGLHNNNGLGWGPSANDVAIGSAASGTLHIARLANGTGEVSVRESIPMDTIVDNPTFFKDPYATKDNDASGYVVAGLSRAVDLAKTATDPEGKDPVAVWLVRPRQGENAADQAGWERTLLFEDDGTRIRSASAGVLVAIDPELEGGRKKAWLLVTGFSSNNIIAVKVDL